MTASTLRTVCRFASFAFALALTCAAQDNKPQPPDSSHKFSSTTELVLVPVLVRDKSGAHVGGLTKDDFQISENGKAKNLAVFEEVKASTAPAQRAAASSGVYTNMLQPPQDSSMKRVVVIAIDQINSGYLDQARARRQLAEHLSQAVGDGSLIALVRIHYGGITVLHDFTSDPKTLVAGLRVVLTLEKGSMSPLEGETLNTSLPSAVVDNAVMAECKTALANAIEVKEFYNRFQQKSYFMAQTAAIQVTLDSMEHIAHMLSGVPGRKSLIWLTGSFPLSLNPFSEALDGQGKMYFRRTLQALNDANVAVYPVDVRGVINTEFKGLDANYPTQLEKANRGDIRVPEHISANSFAEDPGKLRMEAMRGMAAYTGGLAFYNDNDVTDGIRRAIDDSSKYYMLGYYRGEKVSSLQWKPLQVKVRGAGLQVRTRTGLFAGQTSDKALNAELVNAMNSPWDYTGIPLSVRWSSAAAGNGGQQKKNVPFEVVINPSAVDLNAHRLQLQYAAAVRAVDGRDITRWGQSLEGEISPEQEKQIASTGISYRNALSLAAGKYLVRFVVRDDVTGHIGSVLAPLEVN